MYIYSVIKQEDLEENGNYDHYVKYVKKKQNQKARLYKQVDEGTTCKQCYYYQVQKPHNNMFIEWTS